MNRVVVAHVGHMEPIILVWSSYFDLWYSMEHHPSFLVNNLGTRVEVRGDREEIAVAGGLGREAFDEGVSTDLLLHHVLVLLGSVDAPHHLPLLQDLSLQEARLLRNRLDGLLFSFNRCLVVFCLLAQLLSNVEGAGRWSCSHSGPFATLGWCLSTIVGRTLVRRITTHALFVCSSWRKQKMYSARFTTRPIRALGGLGIACLPYAGILHA